MIMKKSTTLTAMIATAIGLLSCSENVIEQGLKEAVPLSLSVRTSSADTKAIITSDQLNHGAEIGISLSDDTGVTYDGIDFSNVRFTAEGSSSSQFWKADSDVLLSSNHADLYAYYPYSGKVSDVGSIPVETASQTDYLYSVPVSGINNHNANVGLTLKHALAAVKLTLKRGTYTGQGSITDISVHGENMATGGILDARTGNIRDLTGKGAEIHPYDMRADLGNSGYEVYIMAIPTGRKTDITIDITMDGEEYRIQTDAVVLSQGTAAVIDISINNSSIAVAPVRVSAWKYNSAGNSSLGKSWTVNLTGDTEGIKFSSDVDDEGHVTITATPEFPDAEVNPVSLVAGIASVSESLDENTGARTITLSDISSDIDLGFNSWSLWVSATYEITDITSKTTLLYYSSYPDRVKCTRMKIDGEEVSPANSFSFSTTGEHTASFIFPDKYIIPEACFVKNPNLKSIRIPEGVRKISSLALSQCSNLESVELPQSLTEGGYEVLYSSNALESIVLPDNLVMSYSFLRNCTKLKNVSLPKNMTTLPTSTFMGCTSLKEISIPESVTIIEDSAFEGSGLTSLKIPSKVKAIPYSMCYSCESLETVYLPSGISSIGDRAFLSCTALANVYFANSENRNGHLNIPESVTKVGYSAFSGCEGLTALSVPAALTEIGYSAFTGRNIASVAVASGNPAYEKIGDFNGIVEKSTNTLIFGCANADIVPSKVTKIGDYAYYGMPVRKVDLHEGITYIGNYAFCNTNTLKEIISRAAVPPALGTTRVFSNPATWGYVYVHQDVADAYEAAWLTNTNANFLKYYNWRINYIENL